MRYNVLIYVPPLFLPYMKNIHKSTFLALNTGDLLLHEKKNMIANHSYVEQIECAKNLHNTSVVYVCICVIKALVRRRL